jgi:PAS domain S-box-containing protein
MIEQETLEDLYEQAPVGYLTVTAEDSIFRVNKTLLQWTGWKADDLVGRKWYEILLTRAGRAFLDTRIEPLLALQGFSREIALDLVCADGERLPVLMYIVKKGGVQGAPVFHRITIVEATERRSYERRLLEAKQAAEDATESLHALTADLQERLDKRTFELQAANEELNAFSYAVSHSLKANLRRMLASSRALLDDCGDELGHKAREYIDRIEHAGQSTAELIDGLLQLSQCSHADLRRETVDLSKLAAEILSDLAEKDASRRVSWTIEPNLTVSGDAQLMGIVLRNLLGNAWKYTAPRADAQIQVYARQDNDKRFFCIADSGVGFDSQQAYRLFRPFQRLHRADEFPGAGIGLSIVQRIVRRHGGIVEATASPGQGATFRFWLPDAAGD